MRRIVLTLMAVLGLVAGTAPAQAITWGQPDGDEHPHVVTLLFVQDGVGFYSCSGTLLSADLVLTAGHCTGSDDGTPNDLTYVSNAPDPLADYAGGGITAYLEASDHWVSGQAVPHPDYEGFAGYPSTYDIGVVELDEPIVVDEYGQLPEPGFLEALMRAKGKPSDRQVVVVGYGQQGTIPAFEQDDYVRYQGVATIMGLGRSAHQGTHSVQLSNSPGRGIGPGGTCFGDSGGPAFWIDPATGEETTIVVAVTSFGITGQCAGMDFSFRTDIPEAQDFVLPHL